MATSEAAQALVVVPPPPEVVDVVALLVVDVDAVAVGVVVDELLELPQATSTGTSAATASAHTAPRFRVRLDGCISHTPLLAFGNPAARGRVMRRELTRAGVW